ncbi:hypothetical protein [Ralstonia sp. 24A2]|uniref:hypothetical protein n=1 Tax=Ralstonia sp. 24A2 TaxID=3447364 RepID=UPI003F6A0137
MQTIIIQGREFRPIKNGTLAHSTWLMQRVREAGLPSLRLAEGESEQHFGNRVAETVWQSGSALELLAGLLIPADKQDSEWTIEMVKANALFFGGVTDEKAKSDLRELAGGVLFYFFITGLSSSETSPKSDLPGMGDACTSWIGTT